MLQEIMHLCTSYKMLLFVCCVFMLADAQNLRTTSCKKGFFLGKSTTCLPLLRCDAIAKELQLIKGLKGGFVKSIIHVKWNGLDLAYSAPKTKQFEDDFRSGMQLLEQFQESPFIVELVGICHSPMQIVTKFYKHGSADTISQMLRERNFSDSKSLEICLQIVTDYLKIVNFLHSNEHGPRVMCDSNDLKKTLSQYLITDDFHIVLGDLDALPIVRKSSKETIKCGHRQLFGSFVAPEQLWPFAVEPFDDEKMPGYDEKTDIWKIPDIVYYLLGESALAENIKFRLFNLLKRCKSLVPRKRPTAQEILSNFLNEINQVNLAVDMYHNDEL